MGRFKVVPFLSEFCGESVGVQSLELAKERGSLQCLRYAHEHGCAITKQAFAACICNNDVPCLEYVDLHSEDMMQTTACDVTAGTNQLKSLNIATLMAIPALLHGCGVRIN